MSNVKTQHLVVLLFVLSAGSIRPLHTIYALRSLVTQPTSFVHLKSDARQIGCKSFPAGETLRLLYKTPLCLCRLLCSLYLLPLSSYSVVFKER